MSQALFPGWRPDADDRERLGALAAAIEAARPASAPPLKPRRPDQWHITLCFVGNNVEHLVTPRLRDAFARAAERIPPHQFAIERVVYWPKAGVVVALPETSPPLQALCDATRDALRSCSITPEKVTTQPHVTLAYPGKYLPPQPWLDGIDCSDSACSVDSFDLLFNPGGRYESLGAWALTGTGLPPPPHQAGLF